MQDPHFDLARFPEERLAKALDDLSSFGLDKLMTGVAISAIEQFQLDVSWLHFDTTSLSFYGAHESEDPFSMGDGMPPPKVTFGHIGTVASGFPRRVSSFLMNATLPGRNK